MKLKDILKKSPRSSEIQRPEIFKFAKFISFFFIKVFRRFTSRGMDELLEYLSIFLLSIFY